MRIPIVVIICFFLLNLSACKTNQIASQEKTLLKVDSLKGTAKKVYLFKSKRLEVKEMNGSLSYTMVEDEKTNVVQFLYEKDMDKAAFDGGYREEVVFEVPNTSSEKTYVDDELQNSKMLFGRYCFCRGQTGLYKVKQGNLHIKSSKKEIHFELQFKINEVPQIVNEVIY